MGRNVSPYGFFVRYLIVRRQEECGNSTTIRKIIKKSLELEYILKRSYQETKKTETLILK